MLARVGVGEAGMEPGGRKAGRESSGHGSAAGSPLGDGAFAGAAVAFTLILVDLAAGAADVPGPPLLERAIPRLIQSLQRFVFLGAPILIGERSWLWLLPVPAGLLLLLWRRTRRVAMTGARLAAGLVAAWWAAVFLAVCYTLHHGLAVTALVLALPLAVGLASWRRVRVASMGVLAAALTMFPFWAMASADDHREIVQTLPGLLSAGWIPVLAAVGISVFGAVRPARGTRRLGAMWGLSAVCLGALLFSFAFDADLAPGEPSANRFLEDWAYDLALVGTPPQLVWTDKARIHVLADAYGPSPLHYQLQNAGLDYPQRIWPSATGGFFVQVKGAVAWFRSPPDGGRFDAGPTALYRPPQPLGDAAPSPYAFAEDAEHGRVFTLSEWLSAWAFLDRQTGVVTAEGRLSDSAWPYWQLTSDPGAGVFLASSCLEDGGVFEIDLASGRITQKASGLFAYKMALDPERGLLWAARPVSGEVIAIDRATFEVRHRRHVGWGTRDVQRDGRTGELYSCSFLDGEVFRIDPTTAGLASMGRCGRFCRNLVVDSAHDALWVATRDGICRFELGGG